MLIGEIFQMNMTEFKDFVFPINQWSLVETQEEWLGPTGVTVGSYTVHYRATSRTKAEAGGSIRQHCRGTGTVIND
jgi:hypothetical protein